MAASASARDFSPSDSSRQLQPLIRITSIVVEPVPSSTSPLAANVNADSLADDKLDSDDEGRDADDTLLATAQWSDEALARAGQSTRCCLQGHWLICLLATLLLAAGAWMALSLATPPEPSSGAPAPPFAPSTSPSSSPSPSYSLAGQSELVDSALVCANPWASQPSCDLSRWGPRPARTDRGQLSAEELGGDWSLPSDLYSFQTGLFVSPQGPGALVRIFMRDLCCAANATELPQSYFRITAHGAAQAASNPPLALGPMPAALGRGHQPNLIAAQGWGRDVRLDGAVDEERVLQTFLLLPDPGHYSIEVRLTHFNVSRAMVEESYAIHTKAYDDRVGRWIGRLVKNARGHTASRLFVPMDAARTSQAFAQRSMLPLCGEPAAAQPNATLTGAHLPLAGRWVYQPAEGEDWSVDHTDSDRKWLVEHSVWQPYFCRLDEAAPVSSTLESIRWLHFTGDSNTRHLFFSTCALGNGTVIQTDDKIVPRRLDAPKLCLGPSSPDNRPDQASGLELGSSSRWLLTYTSWFWGKLQTFQPEEADGGFGFSSQCARYTEVNATGLFYGWPGCNKAPASLASLRAPGVTFFSWGSHAAELGHNPTTMQTLLGGDAFGSPLYRRFPVVFALTTANIPQNIPAKFGRQQVMRNNERVHSTNLQIIESVTQLHSQFAARPPSLSPKGGRFDDSRAGGPAWMPVFDIWSSTHAALEVLCAPNDAVHFDYFWYRLEPKWLLHYLHHAPNFHADSAAQQGSKRLKEGTKEEEASAASSNARKLMQLSAAIRSDA